VLGVIKKGIFLFVLMVLQV